LRYTPAVVFVWVPAEFICKAIHISGADRLALLSGIKFGIPTSGNPIENKLISSVVILNDGS